ncbi:MAG: hypothetical protein HY748_02305 [Elusimicrobia bacterium]|nr:hypothetical protein [Elusimicrobiota bacterium]
MTVSGPDLTPDAVRCPSCGGTDVRRSSSRFKHCLRVMLNKGHRFCPACGKKWHVHSYIHAPEPGFLGRYSSAALVCAFLAVAAIALGSAMGWDPVRWVKTRVRAGYDAERGKESKGALWSVLGGCYESKSAAKQDYYDHAKDD